jgi:hypothetical protein
VRLERRLARRVADALADLARAACVARVWCVWRGERGERVGVCAWRAVRQR